MFFVVTRAEVEQVVEALRIPDPDERRRAVGWLELWRSRPIGPEAAVALLGAAGQEFPAVDDCWPAVPNRLLLGPLLAKASTVSPELVAEFLPLLAGDARWTAIELLVENGTHDAALVLAAELRRLASDGGLSFPSFPVLHALGRSTSNASVLLPALIDLAGSDELGGLACGVLLPWAERGVFTQADSIAAVTILCPVIERRTEALARDLQLHGPTVRWDEEHGYSDKRHEAGVMLDLLSQLRLGEGRACLEAAALHAERWIALWGVIGLARLGEVPPAAGVERAARDPECRIVMFDALQALGKLDLMPASERTQSKLAEADMVRWLTFPTELGCAPDEIEQIAVVPMEHGSDPADLFAFRFRTTEPHWAAKDGWMVGVAGPFLRGSEPSSQACGSTFSQFEAYNEQDIRGSIESIVGTIENWAAVHGQPPRGSII